MLIVDVLDVAIAVLPENSVNGNAAPVCELNNGGPGQLARMEPSVLPAVDRTHGYAELVRKFFLSHPELAA